MPDFVTVNNLKFTKAVRQAIKTSTGPPARATTNRTMAEDTPLLAARGHSHTQQRFWRHLLLDTRHSPGMESENTLTKALAHTWNVFKVTLTNTYINLLLVFAPIGIAAGELGWAAGWVFGLNFLAIVPLAAVLSFATEEIAKRLGETLGGLLNASFGNATELIVSVIALRAGQIEVVQSSMIGSILSNMLLVMGMCFFLGGIYNIRDDESGVGMQQSFAEGTAQTTCSVLALASASMIIPAALSSVLRDTDRAQKERSILLLSRGTAIILLLLYCLYLYFELRTHKHLFEPESSRPSITGTQPSVGSASTEVADGLNRFSDDMGHIGGGGVCSGAEDDDDKDDDDKDDDEEVLLNPWAAAAVLVVATVVISYCADYMVDSIDAIVASGRISKSFIGLILIPIVANAAEHVTACLVAIKNKMDLAMGVAIGSSIQIALLVTPALVILGWAMGQPMTLHFETFQTVAFAFAVLVVTTTVQDGKSNYLEGAMLMGLYLIIAVAFWVSPADALDKAWSTVSALVRS